MNKIIAALFVISTAFGNEAHLIDSAETLIPDSRLVDTHRSPNYLTSLVYRTSQDPAEVERILLSKLGVNWSRLAEDAEEKSLMKRFADKGIQSFVFILRNTKNNRQNVSAVFARADDQKDGFTWSLVISIQHLLRDFDEAE